MGLITYENLEDGTPVTANIFNERFAQIIAQLNGNINDENLQDDGISKEKLKAEVYESLYPVGSMYVNFTVNTNPATLLGFGTWTAVAGKFIAGYDGTVTEFNAAEKTGGSKDLAAHSHTISNLFMPSGTGSLTLNDRNGDKLLVSDNAANGSNGENFAGTKSTDSAGAGDGANLPPYIVGYVWKRVS